MADKKEQDKPDFNRDNVYISEFYEPIILQTKGKNLMNKGISEDRSTLVAQKASVEFNWLEENLEISFGNWVSSSEGFFYWENLDKKVLQDINKLFNVNLLEKIKGQLKSN